MPIHDVSYKLHTEANTSTTEYTSTYAYDPQPAPPKLKAKLRFYWTAIKWLWQHRQEPNNRHKWRRMMKEVQE